MSIKLDIGKLKFSMIDTEIPKLVDETISKLKPLALDKKIAFITDIRHNGSVFCDPNRVEQVISNLVRNSIDFVPDSGKGRITIRVENSFDKNNHSNMTVFTVEDNGIGIDPEKADKLFQKFYQIDTGFTRKHSGTGLGLGICKGIIDAHGGRIWFDKSYRSGVAIKFGLPDRIRNN